MPVRCGVIGVGYLGRFHAQKYAALPQAELVGVYDLHPETAETVAKECQTKAYTDMQALIQDVDAVSIAVSTAAHYAIALECLTQGRHVLVEKPITESLKQADELIALAMKKKCILQVGHLERFNAARLALDEYLDNPLFIESQRLAPFNPRGADVNVILDLMIHDIDLIHAMVNSPIVDIDAHGAPILSNNIDIANARIHFANHCIANVTASRISFKTLRKTRIFQRHSYISIDYQNKEFAVFRKGDGEMFPGIPDVVQHQSVFEKNDALLEEIKAFITCIQEHKKPLVSGEEGRNALETAQKITALITEKLRTRYEV